MVDGVGASDNVFHGGNALRARGVGQHHLAVGVANAVDVRHDLTAIRFQNLHVFVDGDKAAVGFNAPVLQAHVFGVGDAPRGDHAGVHFEGFDVFSVFLCVFSVSKRRITA